MFRGFGVDPTQYRSAAEALLRRLTKQGELPSIGTLVDLANLVSIRYALPVAVFPLFERDDVEAWPATIDRLMRERRGLVRDHLAMRRVMEHVDEIRAWLASVGDAAPPKPRGG